MLHFMRRFANSWGGKILGAALVLALAAFGVPSILATLDANNITRVGDQDISALDFQRLYQQNLSAYAQQTGQFLTNEQALAIGIPVSVLSQLTTRAALNQYAIRSGIGASDAKLAELVRTDPNFTGVLGSFDRSIFEQTIAQLGLTTEQYLDTRRELARGQQIRIGLLGGSVFSKTGSELIHRHESELRTIEYFTLNATSLATSPQPTEADLAAYLTEHQSEYRTRETRTADVLLLTLETLAALPKYQPTEEELQAEYASIKDSLTRVERRTIKQVVLPNADAEKIFTDQLAAGADFDTALAASGLTATDIGTLTQSEVNDPALATAAFGLAEAGDFIIIPGVGGKRVVAVTAIEAGGEVPFEDARADLVTRLSLAKARADYLDIQDQIEELRAAFQPLKQIAERFGLPVTTVAVTAAGAELEAVPGLAQENRSQAALAIFAGEVGKLSAAVSYGANANLWYDLTAIDPARDQTLDEVREAVTTAWTDAETDKALRAEIDEIVAELDGGKSFTDLATERSQFPLSSAPFTRRGDGTPIISQGVAASVFSGAADSHGWAINEDGEYMVFHVVDVTPPTEESDATLAANLAEINRSALYNDFVTSLTDEYWPPSARSAAYQKMLTLLTTTTLQ